MEKIVRTLKSLWWFFLGYAVLLVAALFVLNMTLPSQYSAQTKIFVTPSSNSALANIYDAPFTDRAVKTVTLLTSGDDITNGISQATGIPAAEVKASFKASNVTGTQIIQIVVSNKKANNVTAIAEAIPSVVDNLLKSIQANTDDKNQIRVSVAEQPGEPTLDSTSKIKTMGGLFILALVIGYVFICLFDTSDNTIRSESDVEKIGISYLGEFGQTPTVDRLIASIVKEKDSSIAEALREIRTKIIFGENNSSLKTIAITSPHGKEGKTFFATALALILHEAGKKVIVIDADLKSSGISRLFSLSTKKGLSDYFIGNASNDDILHKTSIDNFLVIPHGTKPEEHLSTLLSRKSFVTLKDLFLKNAKADYVILDSPSLSTASDTSVIAKSSDGVIILAESANTKKQELLEAKNSLVKMNVNVIGAVISKSKLKKS